MKKILLAALIVSSVTSKAQFTLDYLKAGDDYFRKADYISAAQYYEKYLAGNTKATTAAYNPYVIQKGSKKSVGPVSSRELAIYRTGESYRMLNYPAKAETYYKQALEFDKEQFPLARFHYATMLRALARYEEAEQSFTTFLAEYATEDAHREMARRELDNLRFIQAQLKRADLQLYTLNKAGNGLNGPGANYAPTWMNDGSLLFTSTRPVDSNAKKVEYTNRMYHAVYSEGVAGNLSRLNVPQASEVHQGVASFSADGNTLYFTRWTADHSGKKSSSIYSSTRSDNKWSEPVMMDAVLNASGSSNQSPFVMPGGKHMLFVSDREGGQGGLDIWVADLDETGKPVSATNMGPNINTKFDEQAPYFHTPSNTLVFSSNGRVGMGGYDFYFSKGSGSNWSVPENFGYPVNSIKDDLYFSSRGSAKNILESVLFSSDRDAACCLEIFSLGKVRPMKQISGTVVSCITGEPLPGINVAIVDTINNKTISTLTTDAQGRYTFTMEDFQPLKAEASAKGYLSNMQHFNQPADPEAIVLNNPAFCMAKPVTVLDNIYYEFAKAYLLEESFSSLDKIASMMTENPTMEVEIGGHTDSKGDNKLNQELSEARAQSVVDYLVSKGIDVNRLHAKGYGATKPVAPNKNPNGTDNPEGRQKNRRTEFRILHY